MILAALLAANPGAAPGIDAGVPSDPAISAEPNPRELEHEAMTQLKSIYVSEKAYFAEYDRWGIDFVQIGFVPDALCPDGARQKIKVREGPSVAVGCHFSYSVELHKELGFVATARGEVGRTRGRSFRVVGLGPSSGVVEELPARR